MRVLEWKNAREAPGWAEPGLRVPPALTSEAGPVSAPGQEKVTNSWQRLWTTKQQTAERRESREWTLQPRARTDTHSFVCAHVCLLLIYCTRCRRFGYFRPKVLAGKRRQLSNIITTDPLPKNRRVHESKSANSPRRNCGDAVGGDAGTLRFCPGAHAPSSWSATLRYKGPTEEETHKKKKQNAQNLLRVSPPCKEDSAKVKRSGLRNRGGRTQGRASQGNRSVTWTLRHRS